jgi:hypothetical protein
MELKDLHDKVLKFIAREAPDFADATITPDTNLINAGVLDDAATERLVLFVEGLLNREIPIGEFHIDKISSTASIHRHYLQRVS